VLSYDVAAFTGDYKDLIENDRQVGGVFGSRTNPATFQSVNIGRARISGFEFKGELDFTDNGNGFSVPFAYGQTRGRDRTNNRPLNSIDPSKASRGHQVPGAGVERAPGRGEPRAQEMVRHRRQRSHDRHAVPARPQPPPSTSAHSGASARTCA
jgi:hypothetical protein